MWMRRPSLAPVAASLLLGSLAVGGCTAPPDPSPTLAVVLPALEGRFQDLADVLEQRATAAGYAVSVHGTDGDIPAQVTTVAELIDERVDVLVVWPIDDTSLTPVIDDASAATEVIALGRLIRNTAQLDAYVGFDPVASAGAQVDGVMNRLAAADWVGPLRVEVFVGSPEDPTTAVMHQTLVGDLQGGLDSGMFEIPSGEIALDEVTTLRGNAETAKSRMARILREDYDGTVPFAVFTTSDEIARGVSEAVLEAGGVPRESFPMITGRGAQLRSIVAILEARQFSTQLEDPRVLAEAAADRAIALLTPRAEGGGSLIDNGAALIPATLVPGIPVQVDDIQPVVVESGYWSRERIADALDEYGVGTSFPLLG